MLKKSTQSINHRNSDFFNLQYAVRHFQQNYPDDYDQVEKIYQGFERFVLENTTSWRSQNDDDGRLFIYSEFFLPFSEETPSYFVQQGAIYLCMIFFEHEIDRVAIKENNIDFLLKFFFAEKHESFIQFSSSENVKRSFIKKLLLVLNEHLTTVEMLQKKHNYFTYFSVYVLSIKCSFEKVYNQYIAQGIKLKENMVKFSSSQDVEESSDQTSIYNRWILWYPSNEDPNPDLDLVRAYFFNHHCYNLNLITNSGSISFVNTPGRPEEKAVILKVNIENGHHDIDALLEMFKSSVSSEMRTLQESSHWEYFPYFDSDFHKSQKKQSTKNEIRQSDSVLTNILGLWCWDEYNLHKNNGKNLETVCYDVQEKRKWTEEPVRKKEVDMTGNLNSTLQSSYKKVNDLIAKWHDLFSTTIIKR